MTSFLCKLYMWSIVWKHTAGSQHVILSKTSVDILFSHLIPLRKSTDDNYSLNNNQDITSSMYWSAVDCFLVPPLLVQTVLYQQQVNPISLKCPLHLQLMHWTISPQHPTVHQIMIGLNRPVFPWPYHLNQGSKINLNYHDRNAPSPLPILQRVSYLTDNAPPPPPHPLKGVLPHW